MHLSLFMFSFDSRHGMVSGSRQMTIFYGGQAHVFDDVHPNQVRIFSFTTYLEFSDLGFLCYHLSMLSYDTPWQLAQKSCLQSRNWVNKGNNTVFSSLPKIYPPFHHPVSYLEAKD